jgi:hypothetical protein
MKRLLLAGMLLISLVLFSTSAMAINIPIGFIAYDEPEPGLSAFDIVNMTGPNSDLVDFPVATSLTLSNLGMTVQFTDGGTAIFLPASFQSDGNDPESFDGVPFFITDPSGAPVLPFAATLTGTFSPLTVTLTDGTVGTILPNFIAVFDMHSDGTPLLGDASDPLWAGDFKILEADFTPSNVIPEPGTLVLLGTGFGALVLMRRRRG